MLNLICRGYWFFSKLVQQGATIYVVWAVKQSVKGLWHHIGRPCLLLFSKGFLTHCKEVGSNDTALAFCAIYHGKHHSPTFLFHNDSCFCYSLLFFLIRNGTENINGNTKLGSCSANSICQLETLSIFQIICGRIIAPGVYRVHTVVTWNSICTDLLKSFKATLFIYCYSDVCAIQYYTFSVRISTMCLFPSTCWKACILSLLGIW